MPLSIFDAQLLEKVITEKYTAKETFNKNDIYNILNEMTKTEKYFPVGKRRAGEKYKIFKWFVRYLFYRSLSNLDSSVIIEGPKGSAKSSMGIMLAREYCNILGWSFSTKKHMAYTNSQLMDRIDNLPIFSPIVCVGGTTKVFIKSPDLDYPHYVRINTLVGRTDFEVMSYNTETKQFEFVKPEGCIETHHRAKAYKLELEDGTTISATENHKFLTLNGYKELKDLTLDDEIIMYSIPCKQCKKDFVPVNYGAKFCSKLCRSKHETESNKVSQSFKIYQDNYRDINRERIRLRSKKRALDHPEIIRQNGRRYFEKHKKECNNRCRANYFLNKDKMLLDNKNYRQTHKEEMRQYNNNRHKILMATDPEYKIKKNLRRRFNIALKSQNADKCVSFNKYIGTTIPDLKIYLEERFTPIMSWDNYGSVWHVDHIRPCASFDLTLEECQIECFNYKNLLPLLGSENLSKGAKWLV